MNIYRKPLFLLREGERFTHENENYTVYQHEGNMTEVFKNGRFYAWPNWNGKSPLIVNCIRDEDYTSKFVRTPVRETT